MIILQALWVMPLMIRNTRGQEESGLLEMVRARNVGRTAAITAASLELLIDSAIMGILYFVSLAAVNMGGTDLYGDFLFSLGMVIANLLFGAIALLFAQLTNNTRTANMLSYMVLTAAYLVRLVTDIQHQNLTWLSPIGWFEKANFYTDNNVWALGLALLVSILLAASATMIARNRDLGAGIIAERTGRAKAAGWLRSIPALLWRTERRLFAGWLIGAVVFGGVMGSVLGSVGDILKTNPLYRKILDVGQINAANQTMVLSFLGMYLGIFVALAVTAGVQVAFRLKRDDNLGYLSVIHAEKPTRTTISVSYYCFGLLAGVFVLSAGLLALFFNIDAGVIVKYGDQIMYQHQAEKIFPAGSLIDLAIAAYIEDQWKKTPEVVDEKMEVTDLSRVRGWYFGDLRLTNWSVRDIVYLTSALSDNVATNLLIEKFDIYEIDEWLKQNYPGIRLGRELMRYSANGQDNECTAISIDKLITHLMTTQNLFCALVRKGLSIILFQQI